MTVLQFMEKIFTFLCRPIYRQDFQKEVWWGQVAAGSEAKLREYATS